MARFPCLTPAFLFLLFWSLPALATTPTFKAKVIAAYPHDPQSSTQGLVFMDGMLLESTGGYGHSTIREVRLETGEVLRTTKLNPDHFGEGLAVLHGKAYVLTWLSGEGYIFDLSDFKESWPDFIQTGTFSTPPMDGATEGWGLAFDGKHLLLSNGSSKLRWLAPATMEVVRTVTVVNGEKEIPYLNELEWVNGFILANIWKRERIAVIAPDTGLVRAWIDLSPLITRRNRRAGVPNGIAYDAVGKRLFVTGKRWDTLYEIKVPEMLQAEE